MTSVGAVTMIPGKKDSCIFDVSRRCFTISVPEQFDYDYLCKVLRVI